MTRNGCNKLPRERIKITSVGTSGLRLLSSIYFIFFNAFVRKKYLFSFFKSN